MIAVEGEPFHDADGRRALFEALPRRWRERRGARARQATSTTRRSRVAMADRLHELIDGRRDDRATRRSRELRAPGRRGAPIIGAGGGTGLSAKCAEAGGIDLIIIYNSGRYRMAGRGWLAGLMPYGDANAIVVDMAARGAAGRERHARARRRLRHRPVPADAGFLDELIRIGFAGVQNFPTVGLFDGTFRVEARGDRHGLRARGRDDPARARARPADRAVRVQRRRGDRRWRRRAPTSSSRTWA